MNIAALSLAQSPPLAVPLRFFLTAPLLLAAAALLLLWQGPELLLSRWSPGMLAATHLVTLGFAAQVMVGAIQQLLPVLAAAPLPRPRLTARLIHLPLTAGTLALAAGFVTATPLALVIALPLLGMAALLFLLATLYALRGNRSHHATTRGIQWALAAFAITALLGLLLLAGWALPEVALRRQLTDLHAAWGALGWILLLVVAVAYTVVPMFQVTPEYPRSMQRWLLPAMVLALAGWSLLRANGGEDVAWLPALLLTAGAVTFALTTVQLQQRRRRRLADVTVDYWRLGVGALLTAAAAWWGRLALPGWAPSLELLAGLLLLVGFGVSVMSGMLYKIVPFLVWLHLNNQLQQAGRPLGEVPHMKQVIPDAHARRQFHLHLAALAFLVATLIWPPLARPAALLWLASSLALGRNLLAAARLYQRRLTPTP